MKPILLIMMLILTGCAFSLMYGLHIEYADDGDEAKEELGDTKKDK